MQPIEQRIHYKFRNSLLLAEALTHSSLAYEVNKPHFDNQRLEFLGDSVLQLVVTEELFRRFPHSAEGEMTKMRSMLVSTKSLADYSTSLKLGDYLLLGKGEESSGGRYRSSTLADAFEALLGAMFLDGGIEPAKKLIMQFANIAEIENLHATQSGNPKGELQEVLQAIHPEAPIYNILSEEGPDHCRIFQAEVSWLTNTLGVGLGKSKKEAETKAAENALEKKAWE